jgi:hypothetical protein
MAPSLRDSAPDTHETTRLATYSTMSSLIFPILFGASSSSSLQFREGDLLDLEIEAA